MPYTPPPYTAVDFDGDAVVYTPPPYTAVDFDTAAAASLQVEGSDTAFDLMFADVTPPTYQVAAEGSATAFDTVSAQLVAAASVAEVSAAANDVTSCGFLRTGAVAEGSATANDSTNASVDPFVPQYEDVFPIADVLEGDWLPSVGTEFWPVLDEPNTPNYTDFIYSPPNPTIGEPFELRFAPLPDYAGNTRYHSIDIALEAINFTTTFDFELRESATVLDSWSETVTVAQGEVLRSRQFDPAVIALITNRADVRIRGVAHA